MHICADAPLALSEADHLSVESSSVTGSHRELNDRGPDTANVAPDLADEFYFDICLSGSLSDLVVNFDDNVYCTDTANGPEVAQAAVKQTDPHAKNHATLSQVKFWWREAIEEQQPRHFHYPLEQLNPKLDAFDDFESADADGITEDGLADEKGDVEVPETQKTDGESLSGSEYSHRDSVTTAHSIHASSNSLRSTTPDPHTQLPPSSLLVHTPDQPRRVSPEDQHRVHSELEALRARHPMGSGSDEPNADFAQDLNRMSVEVLRLYVEQLSTEVMNLSDQLVELLAARDELVMLREASDDFVILLSLVHQRRARASRAALLLTARTRLRPRGLFRMAFPWLNRSVGLTSACSMSSVVDPVDGLRPAGQTPSANAAGSGTLPRLPTDTIDLNASTGSAAYYKSLNLHSKQRRPRAQGLPGSTQLPPVENGGTVGNSSVHEVHSDHQVICPNGSASTASFQARPWDQVNLVSPEAKQRLDALRKQCDSLPWPHGQPQSSQSLNLCLPYRFDRNSGVTLSTLRVINQILHGTLLENPSTVKLVNAYVNNLSDASKVTAWMDRNHQWRANGHVERTNPA